MKCIKVTLAGIVIILASLFFMGICILDHDGPESIALGLFVLGMTVSIIGLFFVKDGEGSGDDDNNDKE